ncbi:MAG TPA: hypothetical protein VLZ12_13010 [Verrucomicrobiae bacterium]|nr:hypothetical protein [Verrucomicrobiae bacterium]
MSGRHLRVLAIAPSIGAKADDANTSCDEPQWGRWERLFVRPPRVDARRERPAGRLHDQVRRDTPSIIDFIGILLSDTL